MPETRKNKEVLFTDESIVTLAHSDIERLIAQSESLERKRIRLCTHADESDKLHEMFIIHRWNTYVRPHRHINKSESFHVISGEADVVIFDSDGLVTDVIEMGDLTSKRKFYFRISEGFYHTLVIRSELLVFHETTTGPFRKVDTEYLPSAPSENDTALVDQYVTRLISDVSHFKTKK